MAGFPSRQPWANISLAAAGLTLFLAAPRFGWATAAALALLAPVGVFAAFMVAARLFAREPGRDADEKSDDA